MASKWPEESILRARGGVDGPTRPSIWGLDWFCHSPCPAPTPLVWNWALRVFYSTYLELIFYLGQGPAFESQ